MKEGALSHLCDVAVKLLFALVYFQGENCVVLRVLVASDGMWVFVVKNLVPKLYHTSENGPHTRQHTKRCEMSFHVLIV
jgi:hypothetical protein